MRILTILLLLLGAPTLLAGQINALFVGNNKGGTVSVINTETLGVEKTIDIAPEKGEKTKQTLINNYVNRKLGPKYVDDIDILPNGTTMVVSRPYFMDIAAFDINTGKQLWKIFLKKRPDHQVMTSDGQYLFVSLLVSKKGVKIDLEQQKIVGYYKTGRRPHSIVLNKAETKVYNGSLEGDDIVIIDVNSLQEIDRLPFPEGVRPFKISEDEQYIYAQLSFCHCLVEYDINKQEVIRKVELPIPDFVKEIPLKEYPFDAAHHGIGFEKDKKFMSIAGTVSNYAAILRFPELEVIQTFDAGIEPSWITDGFNGDTFFVSARGSDKVYVYSYSAQTLLKEIAVGEYPQRMAKGIWQKK